jgi:hypothetical protein
MLVNSLFIRPRRRQQMSMRVVWRAGCIVIALAIFAGLARAQDVGQSVGVLQIQGDGDGNTVTFIASPDGVMQLNGGEVTVNGPAPAPRPQGARAGNSGRAGSAGGNSVAAGAPNGVPFDINQIRQRMEDALKEALGCTDEEWAVLKPKIEKIQLLQGAAGERTSGMVGVTAGNNSSALPPAVTEVRARQAEFQKAVSNKDSSDGQVRQAMAALREAKQKARTELAKSRKELLDLVTPRQEATLYQRGILD